MPDKGLSMLAPREKKIRHAIVKNSEKNLLKCLTNLVFFAHFIGQFATLCYYFDSILERGFEFSRQLETKS